MLLHLALVGMLTAAPTAATAWERADAHAAAGRHDDAVLEYALAWDEHAAAPILYSWAQSERLRGRCDEAVPLYDRFLAHETPPPEYDTEALRAQWASMRDNARAQAHVCREQLPAPEEPATVASEPAPPRISAPPPTIPATDRDVPSKPRRAPHPWWRDAAGWSLSATGLAALVTGATLVGVAARTSDNAEDNRTHQSFRDDIDRAQLEQRVGVAMLAVGGALVVAGTIRWAVVARRHRKSWRAAQLGLFDVRF